MRFQQKPFVSSTGLDSFIRQKSNTCWDCGCVIQPEAPERFAFLAAPCGRENRWTARQCCDFCGDSDEALQDAKADGRRFTEIGVRSGIDRCACGSVAVGSLGWCIECSKQIRMIGKFAAESRFISKALRELRKEIKQQSKIQKEEKL
jgi:hypothetical protein